MSSNSSDAQRDGQAIPAPLPQKASKFSFAAAAQKAREAKSTGAGPTSAAIPAQTASRPASPRPTAPSSKPFTGFRTAAAGGAPSAGGIPAQTPASAATGGKFSFSASSSSGGATGQTSFPKFSFGAAAGGGTSREQMAAHIASLAAPDTLAGTLMEIRTYHNDWCLGKVTDHVTGRKVSVKGSALAGLQIGMRYRFKGKKSDHPKFGPQFDVAQAEPDVESPDALINHIIRNYRNAGYSVAKKLVSHYQQAGTLDELKNLLIHRPAAVDFSPFTNAQVTLLDGEENQVRRVRDSLAIRFGGMGIAQGVFRDLALWLKGKADMKILSEEKGRDLVSVSNEILDENPYKPMKSVERYGFGTAELIAGRVGIERHDPKRIAALVTYALDEGCSAGGHMYLEEAAFFSAIRRLDGSLNPHEAVRIAIEQEAPIVIDASGHAARFYTKWLRDDETRLVDILAARLTTEVRPLVSLEGEELNAAVAEAVRAVGQSKGNPNFELDESQMQALLGILTSTCSLHTLTAGPGCGKTAIVEVLMEVIGKQKFNGKSKSKQGRAIRTTFCAPIGKAAKVLTNRIKKWGSAKTIHSTLEFNGTFQRNVDNPLETDFVVADEQSMLGGPLGAAFLEAIPMKAHILMLGDPGQLAPIEPGQVLKSILSMEGFDHHRLHKTHRNSGAILELVHMANDGMWPTDPAHIAELLSRGDVEFAGNLPEPTEAAFAQLAIEVKQAAEHYGGLERVGVICPVRKGNTTTPGWNVTYLNAVLRDALNPDPLEEKKIAGSSFRLNDRIIVTKNMNLELLSGGDEGGAAASNASGRPVFDEAGDEIDEIFSDENEGNGPETYVVNGDTGWLESVEYTTSDNARKPKSFVLRLDDGRRVRFTGAMDEISLSYAITVHAAQGSEYSKTFAIVTPGHEQFMHRALVMTQISRAQSCLKVYGDQSTLIQVCARPAPRRNCALLERALGEAGEILGENVQETHTQARQRQAA